MTRDNSHNMGVHSGGHGWLPVIVRGPPLLLLGLACEPVGVVKTKKRVDCGLLVDLVNYKEWDGQISSLSVI
jgi:hypothetical protein